MNPIIEKIKKLLRMKRGGTPDEIATALRLAQELAEKHGIDLGKVNPDEEESPIHHQDAIHGARIQCECIYASLIAEQFFHVTAFKTVDDSRSKYVMRFVGTDWDTQIALYVYYFLARHFRSEWKHKRGRLRNRQAFMWGMFLGVKMQLKAKQPKPVQTPGIVPVERGLQRRNQYIEQRWGKLDSESVAPDNDSEKARRAGFVAGLETEINSGVKGGKKQGALIVDASRQLGF